MHKQKRKDTGEEDRNVLMLACIAEFMALQIRGARDGPCVGCLHGAPSQKHNTCVSGVWAFAEDSADFKEAQAGLLSAPVIAAYLYHLACDSGEGDPNALTRYGTILVENASVNAAVHQAGLRGKERIFELALEMSRATQHAVPYISGSELDQAGDERGPDALVIEDDSKSLLPQ